MTDIRVINLDNRVKSLDGFILYRTITGDVEGLKQNDLIELSIASTFEITKCVYQIKQIEYDKKNTFIAKILLLRTESDFND